MGEIEVVLKEDVLKEDFSAACIGISSPGKEQALKSGWKRWDGDYISAEERRKDAFFLLILMLELLQHL